MRGKCPWGTNGRIETSQVFHIDNLYRSTFLVIASNNPNTTFTLSNTFPVLDPNRPLEVLSQVHSWNSDDIPPEMSQLLTIAVETRCVPFLPASVTVRARSLQKCFRCGALG